MSLNLRTLAHEDIREYTLPAGTIAENGFAALSAFCFDKHALWEHVQDTGKYMFPSTIAWEFRDQQGDQYTVTGNSSILKRPVGTFTKRFGRWVKREYGYKIPTEHLQEIGNLVSKHTLRESKFRIDFTRRINWRSGDYGDSGSCYWKGNSDAKDMLEDNGAYAVRLYDDEDNGIGRAWLAPAGKVWALFNAYGPHCLVTIARVLSDSWGGAYTQIWLTNNDADDGTLYINGGKGYAIGAQEDIDALGESPQYDFGWDDSSTRCACCAEYVHDDDCYSSPDGDSLCQDCFYENYVHCGRCAEATSHDDAIRYGDYDYCTYCADSMGLRQCDSCSEYHESLTDTVDGEFCEDCACDYSPCERCDQWVDDATEFNGEYYCAVCVAAVSVVCADCNERIATDEALSFHNQAHCTDCAEAHSEEGCAA